MWTYIGILGGVIILGIIAVIIRNKLYRHTFVIWRHTDKGDFVKNVKAWIRHPKDGADHFQIQGHPKAPIPPKDCFKLTKKGDYWVEAVLDENQKYTFLKSYFYDKDGNMHHAFKAPVTTNDKEWYINQLRRAASRYKDKDWKQHLPVIVSIMAVVILVIAIFAFWGEIYKPFEQATAQQQKTQKLINDGLREYRQACGNVQIVPSEDDGGGGG